MVSLETVYLGIQLKNPIIVSSSGLTDSVEKIVKIEKNGAGAVVLKSLFEEQINHEAGKLVITSDYPEAINYITSYTRENAIDEYLKLISDAKKVVKIPVIASINCVSSYEWTDFAKKIEEAGADALELNVFVLPVDKNALANKYENVYFDLAGKIKRLVNIPIAIKLGSNFTNLTALVNRLQATGINGVVLFNRFYEPDIDIDKMQIISSSVFSSPDDYNKTLRWIGIIHDKVPKMDLSASTGIHDGKTAVKQILAGAKSVQVCSTIYKNGHKQIKIILDEITEWMNKKGFDSIEKFRGRLSYKSIIDPSLYERAQFMKYFSNLE